jgi:BirA family biotin operon repressor/biotin-[acetyl-CoA-carboxylase] ligase
MRKITIGKPLLELPSVDSTNNFATALLQKSAVIEGTVIMAAHQTQGRGQAGNLWISNTGSNLLCSIILKPDFLMAERQFYLSMCISNAILDTVAALVKPVQIKWPNDILLNGKKVAGILIENTILGKCINTSIVGIGLNINQKEFPADLPYATSIGVETGHDYDLSDSLSRLIKCLNHHINSLYAEEFASIKTNYLNNLWLMNEWARFSDQSGVFEGRIADIADTGELIVVLRDGVLKQYGFKEIRFLL